MQFIVHRRGYKFVLPLVGLIMAAAVAGFLSMSVSADAPITTPLEIDDDANGADSNGCATFPPDDWECVNAGTDHAVQSTFIPQSVEGTANDGIAGEDGTSFHAGGSKDEKDISAGGATSQFWQWDDDGPGPDKDDITNAMAALYAGVNIPGGPSNQTILYLGADVFQNFGAATLAFWVLRDEVGLEASPPSFVGHHIDGDVLTIVEFSVGGSISTVRVARWLTGADSNADCSPGTLFGDNLCTVFFGSGAECTNLPTPVTVIACAEANETEQTTEWDYQAKNEPADTRPVGHFLEAMVNLTQVFGGTVPCLHSFLAETRSSPSSDARLWDFALDDFDTCGTIIVEKVCDGGTGATFDYTRTGTDFSSPFDLDCGESTSPDFADLLGGPGGGARSVTEALPLPSGWDFVSVNCVSLNGTSTVSNDNANRTGNITVLGIGDTVTCTFTNRIRGALLIEKRSTKTGNPFVANAGAVFSVDGPDANTTPDFSVTDDITAAAPDEDADVGQVCVSNLSPGSYTINETTPPPGYGGASQTNVAVTVVGGTNCTSNLPSGAAVATFTNPPLYDLQVNFRDGGSGETSATISCPAVEPPDSTTPPATWTTSETYLGQSAPQTVTCTITVDP